MEIILYIGGAVLTIAGGVASFIEISNWLERRRARRNGGASGEAVVITRDLLDELIEARLRQKLSENPAQIQGAAEFARDAKAGFATVADEGGAAGAKALAEARKSGDLSAVKAVLQRLADEDASTGAASNKRAAERLRELGALAFLDDTAEALRAYAKAAEFDPNAYEGWWRLGQLQRRAGNLDAAKASFERLLAMRNRIENPFYIHWAHLLLGDVEAAKGNRLSAQEQYDQALNLIKDLARRDENNAEWQRDLSVSYNKIGDIRAARGDRDGALKAYEDALAIRNKLARRDENNAGWQRDLFVSYVRIGDIRAAGGDRDGALKAYEDGLAIRNNLARRDENNAEWQTDLVVSAWKLANAGAPNGCGHLRGGLAILKRLEAGGKLTADQKDKWIPALEAQIAAQCG